MKPLINGQIPPPPVDAWGAFFEHFDHEIAHGRETEESMRVILEKACNADWEANMRKYQCPPPAVIARFNLFERAMNFMLVDIRRAIQASVVSKVPFWAKKWRGQR